MYTLDASVHVSALNPTEADSSHSVLVIHIDPEMGNIVRLILNRERNDKVKYANGGREGLAAAKQDPPDIIILAIMMPEMDGWDVCSRLRKIPALGNVPVLFMAAMSDLAFVYPEVKRAGGQGYLCAPFGPQELLAARDALLRGETYLP